jgi:hypothetical protein
MADFMTGYRQGYTDALRDLANRGIIAQTAAPLVGTSPSGMAMAIDEAVQTPPKKRRSRTARAQDKKLSQAFKEANMKLRKKDGSLRSGRTQADIARLAHKLKKKM